MAKALRGLWQTWRPRLSSIARHLARRAWTASRRRFQFERLELRTVLSATLGLTIAPGSIPEGGAPLTADFEEVGASLANNSYDNGSGGAGGFQSAGVAFPNQYDMLWGSWAGWAYSTKTDRLTPGYENQYSAYPGSGAERSRTYGVAYAGGELPTIELTAATAGRAFQSLRVANTTYAALSMLQGDMFSKKFGGASGADPDWFLLTIEGLDAAGLSVGTVPFYLADYRFANSAQDYVVTGWTEVHVSSLEGATKLQFSLASSDNGDWGMNTPAYFAVDDVVLDSGPAVGTIRRGDADLSSPLTVSLASSDLTEATVPATVTIPAGQASASFTIGVVDDSIVDGTQTATITATAAGHVPGSAVLEVTDNDTAAEMSVTITPASMPEGGVPLTADFEDVGAALPDESYDNGSGGAGEFQSYGVAFPNQFDMVWGSWAGWACSNTTDRLTPGFENQYSAYPGSGAEGSRTYGVAYAGGELPTIELTAATAGRAFQSLRVANTTYAALSMLQGDMFSKKFGGASGADPDWFLLTIEGLDAAGLSVGTVPFYLADYRFANRAQDYVVAGWTEVDVSSLEGATKLQFSLASSDNGDWGMNTPAYFAVDDVRLGPGPAVGMVERGDTDLSSPLTVSLVSSDLTEATVPATVTIPAGQASASFMIGVVDDSIVDGTQTATITATAPDHLPASAVLEVTDNDTGTAAQVVGRYVFYNNSSFDGSSLQADDRDYDAIAPAAAVGHGHPAEMNEPGKALGKRALLPGQTASFANYTSSAQGINGIVIAIDNLASPAAVSAADFVFRVGNDSTPGSWAAAPAPTAIRVTENVDHPAFAGHPDVVTFVWADENPYTAQREAGAISNQWLQVTVLPGGHTGLAQSDVFYFGNQIGESGNSASDANVDQNDEIGTRNHPHTAFSRATASDPYDFNRDGKVDQNDEILARNNPASAFTRIQLITAPSMLQSDVSVAGNTAGDAITADALAPTVAEALARWEAAGIREAQLHDLRRAQFVLATFRGSTLGEASREALTVYLDDDAAGAGWFLDPTPGQDEEFSAAGLAAAGSPAYGKIDLLTAVMHEMGHLLGQSDAGAAADDWMAAQLPAGIRRNWADHSSAIHDAALAGDAETA